MSTTEKINRTPNYAAWNFVDARQPFIGSSLRGEVYDLGCATHAAGSWLNEHERDMYEKNQPFITYVVWSFYTPIAYFVENPTPPETPEVPLPGQWYKVGQTFSQFTARHRNGALCNVPGHVVQLTKRRGDNTVDCLDCGTTRHFTYIKDAREAYHLHR